ncbi:MAG: SHOCT domain-containing protein [Bacillota bacterium]|nr:SHOCT domain-containing protein [Bacillota bacterium]
MKLMMYGRYGGFGGYGGYGGGYGYRMMGYGWGILLMLGLLVLIILGIVALSRYIRNSGARYKTAGYNDNQRVHSINILNERYAKGEISREDYFRMRSEIDKDSYQ